MSNEVFEKIEKYREQKANVLVPSVLFADPHGIYEPVLEVIQLSPNTDDRDVYSGGGSGLRLSSVALSKIAQCGGVEWDAAQSVITDRVPGKYVTFKAVGGIRKADGRLIQYQGSYNVDLEVIREELVEQYTKKAGKKKGQERESYINYCVDRDFRQKKKFMLQLAETGARNRVTRGIFSLKSEYSAAELAKPFIMIRYRLRIDYDDPEVRRIAQLSAIQASLGIFGPSQQPRQLPEPVTLPEPETIPDTDDLTGADEMPPELDPEANDFDDSPPTDREIFETYDRATQIRTLKETAHKKGYDFSNQKHPIEQWSPGRLLDFYDHLETMEDKKNAA